MGWQTNEKKLQNELSPLQNESSPSKMEVSSLRYFGIYYFGRYLHRYLSTMDYLQSYLDHVSLIMGVYMHTFNM